MSSKGGLNHQKNGGAQLGTHGITLLVQNNENIADIRGKTVLVEHSVQGIQDGGSLVDMPKSINGFEHLIADSVENETSDDGLAALGDSLAGTGIEWIKASVDELGRVTYDLVNTGALLEQGDVYQGGDNKASVISVGANVSAPPETITICNNIHDSVSGPPETITICNNIHQLCPDGSTGSTATLSPELVKSIESTVCTLTQSSPCSPTNFLELPQNGKPRRFSEGTENLSVQDRACLEELERGSQLTAEEKELLENSKSELAALDFQPFPDKSTALLSPPEIEALPAGELDFVQVVTSKASPSSSLVSSSACDIGSFVSKSPEILSHSSSFSLLSNNSVISSSSLNDLSSANNNGSIQIQDVPSTTAVAPVSGAETSASQQDSATISITTDQTSDMTQIILTTSQGQQVFHINNADLAASIQGNTGLAQANPVLQPTSVIQEAPKSAATGASVAQVQDGFLVIPFGQNGQDQMENVAPAGPESAGASQGAEAKPQTNRSPTSNAAVKWVCSICDQGFSKLSKLKVHSMSHTGERPFKCSTPGCDWAFTTAYKLKRHEESHQGKKEFLCDAEGCGRKFTTIYNLNTHKKLHERPCTEMCPEPGCGECFPTKRLLDQHMRCHGNSTKSYECPHAGCDRKFYSQYCMGSHMRVHQRTTDLVCPFEGCNKKFDKMCRLKQHTRSHTGERPYVCPADGCGWAFSTSSKLRRHLQKHTGERKWTCPHKECGKAFMRMEHLKGHMITHSGQKPFACPVEGCNARFKAKSSMYVHAKKHLHDNTQMKDMKITYYCPLEGCNKKYNSKGALRQHIEKHYQKQQLQSTIGDLIPLLNAEDLESLVQMQADGTETSIDIASPCADSILAPDAGGVTAVSQSDLINSVEQQALLNGVVVSLPDDVSQSLVAQGLGAGVGTSLPLYLSQVKQELASEANAASLPGTSLLSSSPSILLSDRTEVAGQSLLAENNSGSARTDYSHLLSHRAKKRRQFLKEKSTLDLGSISDFTLSRPEVDSDTSTGSSSAPVVNPNEIMTSRAITFRDPETGAIYVQTQLLQDDPPDPDFSGDDDSMDEDDDDSGLSTNLASFLHDGQSVDLGSPPPGMEFTGTTINLQDLE